MGEEDTAQETLHDKDPAPEALPENDTPSDSGPNETTPEAFARFLHWLSPDQEAAVQKYEDLRRRLTKVFRYHGLREAATLADETLERATRKFIKTATPPQAPVTAYLLNIAHKIRLEQTRRPQFVSLSTLQEKDERQPADSDPEASSDCLKKCLGELSSKDRDLFESYHHGKGQSVSEDRKKLAKRLRITLPILRLRIMRLRHTLLPCLEKCLGQQKN